MQEPLGGELRVRLFDAEEITIVGARVEAAYFHHAHSKRRAEVKLVEQEDGVYTAAINADVEGVYRIELVVRSQGTTFTSEQDVTAQ